MDRHLVMLPTVVEGSYIMGQKSVMLPIVMEGSYIMGQKSGNPSYCCGR